MADVTNTQLDKNSRLAIAYGKHPVKGYRIKHRVETVGTVKEVVAKYALGLEEWDGCESLAYDGHPIAEADFFFHNGGPVDIADTLFPGETYPGAAYVNARIRNGFAEEDNPDNIQGVYRTLKIANYNGAGQQIDSDGNPIPGGATPRDYFFYSPSPARVMTDQILRWGLRRATIIDWPQWVDWRDWNAETKPWDDGASTPQDVAAQAQAGGSLAAGNYFLKVISIKGSDVTSASEEVQVTTGGANNKILISWTEVAGVDGYRVYIGTAEDGENKYFTVTPGSTHSLLITTLTGATSGVPPTIATGVFLKQTPRFETHLFFMPPFSLRSTIEKIAEVTCSERQRANGKLYLLSPVGRDPVFTFDLTKMPLGAFKTYPTDGRSKPNAVTVYFRDLSTSLLIPAGEEGAAPIVQIKRDIAPNDVRRTLEINIGGAYSSQAQRTGEFYARTRIDVDQIAEFEGSPDSYPVLPADVVALSDVLPTWNGVKFKIVEKEESEDTKLGYPMKGLLYSPEAYSDTAHGPIKRPLPPVTLNPFAAPPQVTSVTLAEKNVLQADQTVVTSIQVTAQFAAYVSANKGYKGRVYYKKHTEDDTQYKDYGIISPAPDTLVGALEIKGVEKVAYDVKVVPESSFASAGIAGATAYPITIIGKATLPAEPASLTALYNALTKQIDFSFPASVDGDVQAYLLYVVIGGVDTFVKNLGNARAGSYTPPSNWSAAITLKVFTLNWSGWMSAAGRVSSPISPPTLSHVTSVTLTKTNITQSDKTTVMLLKGEVQFAAYSGSQQKGRVYYKKSTDANYTELLGSLLTPDASLKATFEIRGLEAATYNIKVVPEGDFGPLTLAGATAYSITIGVQAAVLKLFDNPLSRPGDFGLGLYAGGWGTGAGDYFGQEVWIDRGIGYRKIGELKQVATGGTASTTLSSNGVVVGTKDTFNTVRVVLNKVVATGTATDADVLAGKNNFFIGRERIGACTITLVSGTTYDLSNLYRGLNDTEQAVTGHGANEDVLLIDDAVVYLPIDFSDIKVISVKAVSFGLTTADVAGSNFTVRGDSIRPRLLRDPIIVQDGSSDWLIQATPNPRSYEEPATYWCEILNPSTGVLVDTVQLKAGVAMAALFETVSSGPMFQCVVLDPDTGATSGSINTQVGISAYTNKNNVISPAWGTSLRVRAVQKIVSSEVGIDATVERPEETNVNFSQFIEIVDGDGAGANKIVIATLNLQAGHTGTRTLRVYKTLGGITTYLVNEGYNPTTSDVFNIVLSGSEVRVYRNRTPGGKPIAVTTLNGLAFPLRLFCDVSGLEADITGVQIADRRVSTIYASRQQIDKFGSNQTELRVQECQKSPYPQIGKGFITAFKGVSLLHGLVSYWKLDETSGTRYDSYGINHLTDNNTVTQLAGKIGNAALFTSANSEWLSCADNASLAFTNAFSISFWIKLTTLTQQQAIAGQWDYQTQGAWLIQTATAGSGELMIALANSLTDAGTSLAQTTGGGIPAASDWIHIVVVYDGTQTGNINRLKLYGGNVQNTLSFTGTIPATLPNSSADFKLGKFGGTLTRYLNGALDAVALWNRPLTASEVTKLYNSGAGLAYPF